VTVMCEPPSERVGRPDFNQIMQMIKTVLVREGQETTDVDFQFKLKIDDEQETTAEETPEPDKEEKNSYIRGVVVNSAGKPVPNVQIQLTPASLRRGFEGNIGWHRTDQQGRFKIEKIDPGKYLLNISATGRYGATTVSADAPQENLTITLKGLGAISGRVILKTDKRPVTRFSLLCTPQTQNPMDGTRWLQGNKGTDYYSPRGDFLVENLAADRYELTVRVTGYANGTAERVEVEEGKTTANIEIEIGSGGSITGIVVTGQDEEPVGGAKVTLDRTGGNPGLALLGITDSDERSVLTDSGGYFELGNLNPGEAILLVSHPDYAPARSQSLRVVDGEESASVIISLTAGGAIEGYVYGEDGKGLSGQLVTAMVMERGISVKAITDEKGCFRITGLEPSSYSVMLGDFTQMFFNRPGVSTKTAVVKEGETTVVNFGAQGAMVYGVVTRRGEPVSAAKVAIRVSDMPFGFDFNANAVTDQRGYYQVQGLEKGHYFVMLSEGMLGIQALTKKQIDIPESAGAYEVNLAYPESVVAGVVISATDQSPVRNASISLVPEEGGYAEQMAQMFGGFTDTTNATVTKMIDIIRT
ncbi:MAG TPA: carboxypeptidase-like regulatory domain-containing protein, partial [bacterium]|nr:carboxypeptidase-like regulatory domain-containing protein [bacterium]